MRLDRPLTFPKMAVAIGWSVPGGADPVYAGRALLRLCLRREDEIAKEFILRDRSGQPHKVTLGAVTRYLPELRPSRVDRLADSFREYAADFELQQRSVAEEEIAKALAPLTKRMAEMERQIATLRPVTVRRPKRRRRGRNRPRLEPFGTTPNHSVP